MRYKTEKLLLTYEATEKSGITKSSLKIIDFANNSTVNQTNFTIDTTLRGYRFMPYKTVIEEAKHFKTEYNSSQIENLEKVYEAFGEMVMASNKDIIHSQLILSLFFHKAIINTVKRSLKENSDCDCTPLPMYFTGKTGFWCQEDYLINTQKLLNNKPDRILTEKEARVHNYLTLNKSNPNISIDKIIRILESKESFLSRVEYIRSNVQGLTNTRVANASAKCVQGDAWGCCGNYEGCCWVWDWICYAHDQDCYISKCQPTWYCLPGCKYP